METASPTSTSRSTASARSAWAPSSSSTRRRDVAHAHRRGERDLQAGLDRVRTLAWKRPRTGLGRTAAPSPQRVSRQRRPRRWLPSCRGTAGPIPPRWRRRWLWPQAPARSAKASTEARRNGVPVPGETPSPLRAAPPCDARRSPCRVASRCRWTTRAGGAAARQRALRRPRYQIQGFAWFVPFWGVNPPGADRPSPGSAPWRYRRAGGGSRRRPAAWRAPLRRLWRRLWRGLDRGVFGSPDSGIPSGGFQGASRCSPRTWEPGKTAGRLCA